MKYATLALGLALLLASVVAAAAGQFLYNNGAGWRYSRPYPNPGQSYGPAWGPRYPYPIAAPPPAPAQLAPQPSPPLGWVYGPYTQCADPPRCSTGTVAVQADGLNVRATPNGLPTLALINGMPFIPLDRQGEWLLIAPACDLTPTWSWTVPVQLFRCWVY